MNKKITFFACLVLLAGIALASCDISGEQNRLVVSVSAMNANAPFFSDVLNQGDSLNNTVDDYVVEDLVPVTFYCRPYSPINTTGPNLPFSDFLVTSYTVTWRRADGGVGVPASYTGATSIRIPVDEEVEAHILLVPFEAKNTPLLQAINYTGASFPDEYLMIATVTFRGHEMGSEREWDFSSELTVNFGDQVIEDSKLP